MLGKSHDPPIHDRNSGARSTCKPAQNTGARIAITAASNDPAAGARATALADRLKLPLVARIEHSAEAYDFYLCVAENRLMLSEAGRNRSKPLTIDFLAGPTGFRGRTANRRRQPMALAIGTRRRETHLVDATAGLARDTWLLAGLGCRVTAIERSPILAVLIEDALARAGCSRHGRLRDLLERTTFIEGDARKILAALSDEDRPDVVYLDPMYTPRNKSALPKKEIRICRKLVGDDDDAAELFRIARQAARRRVVVKRSPHALPLYPEPSVQFRGKTARYDVYLTTTTRSADLESARILRSLTTHEDRQRR